MGTTLTIKKTQAQFTLKYDLFEHQKTTVKFMLKNPWAYIFNQPGTGKTECAIATAAYKFLDGECKNILIVSTLSTLKNVWLSSIEDNNLKSVLKPCVISGTKQQKERTLNNKDYYNTFIVNPDSIDYILNSKIKFDMIIVDEATCFKKHTTQRFKSLSKIVNNSYPSYFYLMTGTPTPNNPSDAFALLKLFNPRQYTNFDTFRRTVEREVRQFTWVALPNYQQTLNELLQPSICFKRDEVLTDLQKTQFEFVRFSMTVEQKKYYLEMKKDFVTELESSVITAPNAAVKLNKLIQILGGSLIDQNGKIICFNNVNKLNTLHDIIKNKIKNKVLIFVSHKAQLDIIYDYLSNFYVCERISGDTQKNKRDEIFKRFKDLLNPIKIIIAMPQCMAHGLTLVSADGIIYYNPVYSNEIYEQANARISRPGQKEIPKVFHLWSTNVDYGIYSKVQKRMSEQDFLLTLLSEE